MGRRGLTVWGMVILALLAGGIYFLTQKSADTAPEQLEELQEQGQSNLDGSSGDEAEQGISVTYNESGYSPAKITIKKGTKVTFVNNSSRSMWTASDPHPVHTDHSDFDPRKGSGRGDSYSYSFNESGTYNYHNHLFTSHRGSVVVE